MALDNKKIADIVNGRFRKMKDICDPIFEAKQLNMALYTGEYYPPVDSDTEYNLTDPQVFPIIRNYLSRSNIQTKIRLDARTSEDYEIREINQAALNWELQEIAMTRLYYNIFFSAFNKGKGYFETCWLHEPGIEIEELDENGKVIRTKIMRNIVNRANAKYVPFESVLVPDPNITVIREQPYYGRELNITIGEMLDKNEALLEGGEEAYWDEKWLKNAREKGVDKKVLDYQIEFVDDNSDISKEDLAFRAAKVPLRMMETKSGDVFYVPVGEDRPINNKREREYWHGHYSIGDFSAFPEDDNYFPMAVTDVIADLQIANSELLNIGLTNLRQSTYQMWISGTPAAQTPDWMFQTRPNGVIRTMGDPTQIQPIRVTDVSRQTENFSQGVSNRIEKATGISSMYASGAGGTNINQTARGAQIIDANIDTNMKMIIDNFREQVVKTIATDFLELNAQYITEEQTFNISGKRGMSELVHVDPSRISANFDVHVNEQPMADQTPASKQASIQNTIQVLQNISNQSQGAVQVDVIPAVEALVDVTPELEGTGEIVVSVDEKGRRDIASLLRGQMPEIKVRDAHMELMQIVSIYVENNELPPEAEELFTQYVEKHMQFIQSQQEIQQTMNLLNQQQIEQQQVGQMANPEVVGDQEGTSNEGYNLGQIA